MDFFTKLAGFLIAKHAIRSYEKDMQNEYYRNQTLLAAQRERELRAEKEQRKLEEKIERMLEEIDEDHRQKVLEHEAKLAEHEAKIAQLKQMEGDHSGEIENEEFFADFERDLVKMYKDSLGERI